MDSLRTPCGFLSGLLWAFSGVLGIVAIRNAGIATAVGTWSSIMVIINFKWGILVFREPVHSLSETCGAFVFLGMGLIGMTKFSSPGSTGCVDDDTTVMRTNDLDQSRKGGCEYEGDYGLTSRFKRGDGDVEEIATKPFTHNVTHVNSNDRCILEKDVRRKRFISMNLFFQPFTQWKIGVLCAGLTGFLAGSSLVPLHYAKLQGVSYLSYYISLTSGALLANIIMWATFF